MSTLRERILRAGKFDENGAYDNAKLRRNRRSELIHAGKFKSVSVNREAVYAFVDGTRWQHGQFISLLTALADVAECSQKAADRLMTYYQGHGDARFGMVRDQLAEKLTALERVLGSRGDG